jgi:DNA-binding transcriptional LysR family regulator
MMELRDLGYFVTCVDSGSLTAAAKRLHVAQPTLSHALARLERAAGERLLVRNADRRGVSPSAAGKTLLLRARRALAEVRGFHEDLKAATGLLTGSMVIAGIQSLNATLLSRTAIAFARAHPPVALTLRTLPAASIAEAVRQHDVDLGVVAGIDRAALRGLISVAILREEIVAVVPERHPLASRRALPLRRLRDEPFILPPEDAPNGAVARAACRAAGFEPRVLLSLDSGEGLRQAVRAGLGVTLLPSAYLAPGEKGIVAVRLNPRPPSRDVLLLSADDHPPSAAAAAFMELLRSSARSANF